MDGVDWHVERGGKGWCHNLKHSEALRHRKSTGDHE